MREARARFVPRWRAAEQGSSLVGTHGRVHGVDAEVAATAMCDHSVVVASFSREISRSETTVGVGASIAMGVPCLHLPTYGKMPQDMVCREAKMVSISFCPPPPQRRSETRRERIRRGFWQSRACLKCCVSDSRSLHASHLVTGVVARSNPEGRGMQVTTTLLIGASGQGPVPGEVRCTHNWRPTCTTGDLTAGIDPPKVVYQHGWSQLLVYPATLQACLALRRMDNQPDYRPRHFHCAPASSRGTQHNTRLPSVCVSYRGVPLAWDDGSGVSHRFPSGRLHQLPSLAYY